MRTQLASLTLVVVTACVGSMPPPTGQPQPDASTADSPILPDEGKKVSGKAMDYFSGDPLAATIETDGITPIMTASAGGDGAYTIEGVPVGSKFYLSASLATPAYRPTRNVATDVADADISQDLYLMSVQDVKNQYTALGKTPLAGTAFFAAELQKANGMPLEGITLTNISLVDGAGAPVPGVLGPYIFGPAGSIVDGDPAQTTTTAHGGRARIAFLDVPPGSFQLKVIDGALTPIAPVTASADGAVIALLKSEGMGGGPQNPSFATDIYPRLQKASQGGLGCANCHTNGGSGGVLRYDEPAANVLAAIQARPGVIDLQTPANSLLLTKPLYEPPPELQNHPNATFLDINDPDYKLFLLWITQGALP